MTEDFGNPSAMHLKGVEAEKYVKEATKTDCRNSESAGKRNSVYLRWYRIRQPGTDRWCTVQTSRNGNHIIITSSRACGSQPAVHCICRNRDFEITYLPVDEQGSVKMECAERSCFKTGYDSWYPPCYVNNEVGAVHAESKRLRRWSHG